VPFVFLSGLGEREGQFARWPGAQVLVKPISVMAIAHVIACTLGRQSER
jgi:hypothetical protein